MGHQKPLFCLSILAAMASLTVQAAEFAIETEVFVGDDPKPFATNVTVFSDGLIYDFAVQPNDRITVLDSEANLFVLADTRKQTQSSLTVDQLIRFVAAQQHEAVTQSESELIRFAARPKFAASFDAKTGQLNLASEHWDYRVETTLVADEQIGAKYHEFANWFTQLNALFRPIPPAVRMELNRELRQRDRFPLHVVVDIKKNGRTRVRQESRHRLIAKLTERERQMLKDWKDRRASYRRLPFHEFRMTQLPALAKRR